MLYYLAMMELDSGTALGCLPVDTFDSRATSEGFTVCVNDKFG